MSRNFSAWSFTQRSSLWKLGCKVLTIKSCSKKSGGLLSRNDLQNKYIQISSKNISFFFFKHQACKSILGPPSRFFSCFSWIVIKFLETIWGKGPTCVLILQTEYLDFTKRWRTWRWTGVGIYLLFIDYHIPTNDMMVEYLEKTSQKIRRRGREVLSGLMLSALGGVTW